MTHPETVLAAFKGYDLKTAGSGSVIFMALLYTNRVKEKADAISREPFTMERSIWPYDM